MDLRLALYDTAARHQLDAADTARLELSAGLAAPPTHLLRKTVLTLAALAASLIGLGLVFWVAAHWDTLGRLGRFALLQGTVLVMVVGAWARPAARGPLSLLALLATGALFAYFGQTYQTGADAWQLFALWAALTLPLALGQRSDLLWAPWALLAMTAVALWVQTYTGHSWRAAPHDLAAHAVGWVLALAVVLLLSPPLQRHTSAGEWALRTALSLAVVMISSSALGGLFQSSVAGHYGLGLLVLAVLAALLSRPAGFDIFGLSAVALGLNALLFGGLARLLFDNSGDDPIGRLLLLGVAAAAMLGGTVALILRLSRERAAAAVEGGAS
ncbi:MAG: DUF2157 domain-containing protein [Rubrivivax sp.]|nr:DUF2157 domain-containing protein [Rubrivivax sp.]